MKHLLKKHTIKIPNNLNVIYMVDRKIIIFTNLISQKQLNLNVQIFLNKNRSIIKVSHFSFYNSSKYRQNQLIFFQGTNTALLKQSILELTTTFYQKLKFVGIGYRAINFKIFENKYLLFKLGYSHFLYFKTVKNVEIFNSKLTKLFLFSHNYHSLTKVVSQICFFKKPDPYKGKGILYEAQKIQFKKPKKI